MFWILISIICLLIMIFCIKRYENLEISLGFLLVLILISLTPLGWVVSLLLTSHIISKEFNINLFTWDNKYTRGIENLLNKKII